MTDQQIATAERAVIGCLAINPGQIYYASEHLKPDDFTIEVLGQIYGDMLSIYQRNGRFSENDMLLIRNRDEILKCAAMIPSVSGFKEYVDAVRWESERRKCVGLAMQIIHDPDISKEDMLSLSAKISDAITEEIADTRIQDLSQVMGSWLMEQNDRTDRTIKTGLGPIDRALSIQPGQMIVVGGRPSAGKTAFGLQLALHMAMQKKRVCFFSYETSQVGLADKMISNYAGIPYDEIVFKRRQAQDQEMAMAAAAISRLPITLINAAGKPVEWISAVAAAKKADVVIVDYLQLMPATKGRSRYEQVTEISMALHTLAQSSGRLVIALAQVGRGGAERERPMMQDLKESGQIEQDADAVILLSWAPDKDGNLEYLCQIAKNKRGRVGCPSITFDGQYQRFLEVVGGGDM